jgi:ribonuclease III
LKADIARLCRDLGYTFNDPHLLEQALTHRSAGVNNNERLEYLGDSIIGFLIADALFAHFPTASEGQLSRLRAGLVKRDTLARIAREYQLGDYLNLGPGELRSGGHTRASILADGLEAIFAAIYLDGGYDKARQVILKIFSQRLQGLNLEDHLKDPKTRLQELLQARKLELPSYEVTEVGGDPHEQTFSVSCRVPGLDESTTGTGASRRKAEQDAATHLLRLLSDD